MWTQLNLNFERNVTFSFQLFDTAKSRTDLSDGYFEGVQSAFFIKIQLPTLLLYLTEVPTLL